MSGKAKQFLSFMLVRPAWQKKNVSSLVLVALFIFGYSTIFGKAPTPPHIKPGDTFGSVDTDGDRRGDSGDVSAEPVANSEERESAESTIGVQPTDDELQRMKQIGKRGRMFDPAEPDPDGEDARPIDKDMLVKGVEIRSHREDWMLLRSEKRKSDQLQAIEDRLSMSRRRKKHFKVSNGDPQ